MTNLPTEYESQMMAAAQDYARDEPSLMQSMSFKHGSIKINDEALPNNEAIVIILDSLHINTYFEGDYDPDNPLPPVCFAMGREEANLEAHVNVPGEGDEDFDTSYFALQSPTGYCKDCPHYQWGSAPKGRGKSCKTKRRLVVIPAGQITVKGKGRNVDIQEEIYEDPEHYKTADPVSAVLPVTSVKNYSKYVKSLSQEHQRPPFGVITRMFTQGDDDTNFKVHFELVEVVTDPDIIPTLIQRNAEARDIIEDPYQEPGEQHSDLDRAVQNTADEFRRTGGR